MTGKKYTTLKTRTGCKYRYLCEPNSVSMLFIWSLKGPENPAKSLSYSDKKIPKHDVASLSLCTVFVCLRACVRKPYLWWNVGSSIVGGQAGWNISDVGLLGPCRLVLLGRCHFWSPGHGAAHLRNPRVVLILVFAMRHWGEPRLRGSIGKVGTLGLSRHVLHLCRAADWLLAIVVASRDLVLWARLGRPHLDVESGLARS